MDYRQDYILRLIHEIIRTLFKLICGIDIDKVPEEEAVPVEILEPCKRLRAMIDDGKINEAENVMTDTVDMADRNGFLEALLFYRYLNGKSDAFLEAHDYTREEIYDGLKYAVSMSGYGGMAEAFLEDL